MVAVFLDLPLIAFAAAPAMSSIWMNSGATASASPYRENTGSASARRGLGAASLAGLFAAAHSDPPASWRRDRKIQGNCGSSILPAARCDALAKRYGRLAHVLVRPYSPAIDADPFPLLQTLRDEHPLLLEQEAGMWILSRYDDIMRALNDWQTYSSAQGNLMTELPNRAGATLGTTDPPRHDRLRGLVQKAFMKRNLEALADPMRAIAAEAVARSPRREAVRLHRGFSSKFTVRVLFAALGLPMGDEADRCATRPC